MDWNDKLVDACIKGDKESILLAIRKGADNLEQGLALACYKNHKEIAELMILKGAKDLNRGLSWACFKGHKNIAELMIEKGATDLDWGLMRAYSGCYRELVLLMIEKGANVDKCSSHDLDDAELEYLVKKRVDLTNSEIYSGYVHYIDKVINIIIKITSNKLPYDLVNLCISY